jgi:hypothetical protein
MAVESMRVSELVHGLPDSDAAVGGAFARITESEALRSAPVLRSLLIYLWEHRGERVSEYGIAVDGLGRSPGFDPKGDATVRVQIARLRTKLKEFYEGEGAGMALRLQVPLGTHELQWTYKKPDPTWISAARRYATRHPLLCLSVAALSSLVALGLGVQLSRRVAVARPLSAAPPPIWQPMLGNGKPVAIIMPNSTGFQWEGAGVTVFQQSLPSFGDWKSSPTLSDLGQKLGPPSLNQVYSVTRHAVAGFKLFRFLNRHTEAIDVIESADLSKEALLRQNTILVGSPNSGAHMRELLGKTNFSLVRGSPSLVRNRSPHPREPAEFEEQLLSKERKIWPGVIAWLPEGPEGSRTVLLVGRWSTALASFLTSTDGMRMVERELKKLGNPDGWEMVVQAEIQADTTVLRTWVVAARQIPASYWN